MRLQAQKLYQNDIAQQPPTAYPRLARPSTPTITPSSRNPLQIPRLDATVPSSLVFLPNEREAAQALYTFLDAGVVTEEDITANWTFDSVLRSALDRWVRPYADKLTIFDIAVVLTDNLEQFICGYDMGPEEVITDCGFNETDNVIAFGIFTHNWQELFIGSKLEKVEKLQPGLGKTALRHLYLALWQNIDCQTPDSALDNSRYIYWQGEEDESGYIEEMVSAGVSLEEEDVYRRTDFFSSLPEWSVYEKLDEKSVWSNERLEALAGRKGLAAQVAAATLRLAMKGKDSYELPHQTWRLGQDLNIAPALVIRWNEHDDVMRIFDDMYQYVIQGEGGGEVHRCFLARTDPESLRACLENIGTYINNLAEIEALLKLVKED